jgi:hypothetical protein
LPFFIILSMTLILGVSFAVMKKNLHPFEMLLIWMIVIIINHNFFTIAAVNLKLIDFSNLPSNYWALVFNRLFLMPLLIVFYFDRMVVRCPYPMWAWLPFGILLLTGIDYLAQLLDLYTYVRWKLWWTLIEWFVLYLLIYYPWLLYRRLPLKELG